MIIFDLACAHGHRFEGWYASTEDYTRQRQAHLVRCPVCDDSAVDKLPSAKVHVGKGAPALPVSPAREPANTERALSPVPAEILQRLRAMVRSAEDVGNRFPEEARKIHYEESPARSIRGQASAEEAEALRDEGIDFAALPAFLTDETH